MRNDKETRRSHHDPECLRWAYSWVAMTSLAASLAPITLPDVDGNLVRLGSLWANQLGTTTLHRFLAPPVGPIPLT